MKIPRHRAALIIVFLISLFPLTSLAQTSTTKEYLLYVLSESADKISLVRFGPNGARIDHQIDTGDMPIDIDGPHGIAISPDRSFYYVSIAHGRPDRKSTRLNSSHVSESRMPSS